MMHDFVRDFETPSQALNSDFSYESVLIFGAICIRQFLKLDEHLFNFELRFLSMPVTNVNSNLFPVPFKGATAGEPFRFQIECKNWKISIRSMSLCEVLHYVLS